MEQEKRSVGKQAALIALSITTVALGAAAVGAALYLRRWARDEYAPDIQYTLGKRRSVTIAKGPTEGMFTVDIRRTAEPAEAKTKPEIVMELSCSADGCTVGGMGGGALEA